VGRPQTCSGRQRAAEAEYEVDEGQRVACSSYLMTGRRITRSLNLVTVFEPCVIILEVKK
jgi:hypothetical protein